MATSLKGQLLLQAHSARVFETMAATTRDSEFQSLTLAAITTNLEVVQATWDTFERRHLQLADAPDAQLEESGYLSGDMYHKAMRDYATAKAALIHRSGELGVKRIRFQNSDTRTAHFMDQGRRQLPEISIPTFSGSFSEWRAFRDLFTSLVLDYGDISDVEKMHYLRTSVTGEAAQLISTLPIASESLTSAWDLLNNRYDNKRLLITSQMDRLFGQSTLSSASAKALNQLLTTTREALNSLSALGAPVREWDLVLVHYLTRRLDPRTREAWEVKCGGATEPPTFDTLQLFVTSRARALECLELTQTTSASATPSRRAARAHAASAAEPGDSGCAHCQGNHFLAFCPAFRALSPARRRQAVVEQRLCYNCLGRHSVNRCQTQKRCQTCGNKHHTLIHTIDAPPPVDAASSKPVPLDKGPNSSHSRSASESSSTRD